MNEGFDINKKIDAKEYRKNLADELRGVIKDSGFDKAREILGVQQKEGIYKKAREEKLAQWLIQKYLSDPNLFGEDMSKISERDIFETIKKEKKIALPNIVVGTKAGVGGRMGRHILKEKYEKDPGVINLKGSCSDIILDSGKNDKGEPKENKYVFIKVVQPRISGLGFLSELVLWNKNKPMEIKGYPSTNELKECKPCVVDELNKIKEKIAKNELFSKKALIGPSIYDVNGNYPPQFETLSNVVVARPLSYSDFLLLEHSHIAREVTEEHNVNDRTIDLIRYSRKNYPNQDKNEILKKDDDIELYKKFILSICSLSEEIDITNNFEKFLKKVEEMPVPPIEILPFFDVKGGYVKVLDDGSINIYGRSDNYGPADKAQVIETLKKDFPDRKFL